MCKGQIRFYGAVQLCSRMYILLGLPGASGDSSGAELALPDVSANKAICTQQPVREIQQLAKAAATAALQEGEWRPRPFRNEGGRAIHREWKTQKNCPHVCHSVYEESVQNNGNISLSTYKYWTFIPITDCSHCCVATVQLIRLDIVRQEDHYKPSSVRDTSVVCYWWCQCTRQFLNTSVSLVNRENSSPNT